MRKFTLAFSNKGSVIPPDEPIIPEVPELSDLVKLGILPKPISEFTDDDIGTEVLIPYTDASGVISGPIVFEVVGVNHHTSDEHQQTITLMTKNIIRNAAFDANEPNNTSSRKYGNNRWSVSNIRQWLNSDGAANEWFTPQHEYDEAPTIDKVSYEAGAYADEPGFLAGFSADILQHFTDITNITAVPEIDGGGSDTTVDKVFLASYTEMGFGEIEGIAEGSHLDKMFRDEDSRIKQLNGSKHDYWMRSPHIFTGNMVNYVDYLGYEIIDSARNGYYRYRSSYSSSLKELI
jgi:hypothetical protein